MSKYIIKNCPALSFSLGFYCDEYQKKCQDCTDCVMKQIVELCKENLNSLETYIDIRSLECTVLQNILKLLDIQEVE